MSCMSRKIRKIKNLTELRERGSRAPFPQEMFDLSWPFRYRCRSEKERKFLASRVRTYAYSRRRGNFKLPSRFKSLVDEISKLDKAKLRIMIYKVKPDISVECRLLRSTFDFANRILTKCIWRFTGKVSDDCARQVDTLRLAKRDWPRNSRLLWPSSPSVTELMVMSRSGKVPERMWKPPKVVNDCYKVRDVAKSLRLANRVLTDNVIGIRSTITVPRKFLPWFRYRDGILFLSVRYNIPAGLTRFLLAQWITSPFNLWLKTNARLKYYLRLVRREEDLERGSPSNHVKHDKTTGRVGANPNTYHGGKSPVADVRRLTALPLRSSRRTQNRQID